VRVESYELAITVKKKFPWNCFGNLELIIPILLRYDIRNREFISWNIRNILSASTYFYVRFPMITVKMGTTIINPNASSVVGLGLISENSNQIKIPFGIEECLIRNNSVCVCVQEDETHLLSTEITRHVHGLANQQKPIKGQPDI
jgi:hypothetical protein